MTETQTATIEDESELQVNEVGFSEPTKPLADLYEQMERKLQEPVPVPDESLNAPAGFDGDAEALKILGERSFVTPDTSPRTETKDFFDRDGNWWHEENGQRIKLNESDNATTAENAKSIAADILSAGFAVRQVHNTEIPQTVAADGTSQQEMTKNVEHVTVYHVINGQLRIDNRSKTVEPSTDSMSEGNGPQRADNDTAESNNDLRPETADDNPSELLQIDLNAAWAMSTEAAASVETDSDDETKTELDAVAQSGQREIQIKHEMKDRPIASVHEGRIHDKTPILTVTRVVIKQVEPLAGLSRLDQGKPIAMDYGAETSKAEALTLPPAEKLGIKLIREETVSGEPEGLEARNEDQREIGTPLATWVVPAKLTESAGVHQSFVEQKTEIEQIDSGSTEPINFAFTELRLPNEEPAAITVVFERPITVAAGDREKILTDNEGTEGAVSNATTDRELSIADIKVPEAAKSSVRSIAELAPGQTDDILAGDLARDIEKQPQAISLAKTEVPARVDADKGGNLEVVSSVIAVESQTNVGLEDTKYAIDIKTEVQTNQSPQSMKEMLQPKHPITKTLKYTRGKFPGSKQEKQRPESVQQRQEKLTDKGDQPIKLSYPEPSRKSQTTTKVIQLPLRYEVTTKEQPRAATETKQPISLEIPVKTVQPTTQERARIIAAPRPAAQQSSDVRSLYNNSREILSGQDRGRANNSPVTVKLAETANLNESGISLTPIKTAQLELAA